MELVDILPQRAVLYCTGVKNKRELFEKLCACAGELTGVPSQDLLTAISDREDLGSTGLGNGIAVPHGKVGGLKQVSAVFARVNPPIEFDAVDDQPVDLVMMLLAPVGAGADHLKALSRVARLLRTEAVVEELRRLDDPERLWNVLTAPLSESDAA